MQGPGWLYSVQATVEPIPSTPNSRQCFKTHCNLDAMRLCWASCHAGDQLDSRGSLGRGEPQQMRCQVDCQAARLGWARATGHLRQCGKLVW